MRITSAAPARSPRWFVASADLARRVRHIWAIDLVRLIGLTLYYVAIIFGLFIIYGGAEYVPPPFIYQGF